MISDGPIVNLDITGNVLNCPAATKGNLTVIYYQATENMLPFLATFLLEVRKKKSKVYSCG